MRDRHGREIRVREKTKQKDPNKYAASPGEETLPWVMLISKSIQIEADRSTKVHSFNRLQRLPTEAPAASRSNRINSVLVSAQPATYVLLCRSASLERSIIKETLQL